MIHMNFIAHNDLLKYICHPKTDDMDSYFILSLMYIFV